MLPSDSERVKNSPGIKIIIISLAIFGLLAGISLYSVATKPNGINVIADGKIIGVTDSEETAQKAMDSICKEKEVARMPLFCITDLSFEPVRVPKDELLDEQGLAQLFRDNLAFHYGAVGLKVNGVTKLVLESKDVAEKIIKELKESYLPSAEDMEKLQINILELSLGEDVEIVPLEVEKEKVISYEEAIELVKYGEEKITYHEVQEGDSLWSIANENNLWVEDLEEANPELATTLLQIGQKVRLIKPEPLLTVELAYEQTVTEKIPFETKYTKSDSLWRGQQVVKKAGVNGSKEVTYYIAKSNDLPVEKTVVNEALLDEPVDKLVTVGTKLMVASRGGGGSGILAWPIRGRITSPFGYRKIAGSREYHTGMDIDGRTGDPVYAAEAGKVIFSGWRGNYGNLVIIDHGDGLSTYYAHTSQLLVSAGTEVNRGDLIAKVGSTGRSSGAHLHLEVRVNGTPTNPRNYLRD